MTSTGIPEIRNPLIYLREQGRRLRIPKAPVAVGIVWLLFVLAGTYISKKYNTPIELCLFKRLTGIPCPTCGSTRGSLLILRGSLLQGWLRNPLVFTLLPLLFCNMLLQLTTGYRFRLNYAGPRRRYITVTLVVVIAVNWGYLIIKEVLI